MSVHPSATPDCENEPLLENRDTTSSSPQSFYSAMGAANSISEAMLEQNYRMDPAELCLIILLIPLAMVIFACSSATVNIIGPRHPSSIRKPFPSRRPSSPDIQNRPGREFSTGRRRRSSAPTCRTVLSRSPGTYSGSAFILGILYNRSCHRDSHFGPDRVAERCCRCGLHR